MTIIIFMRILSRKGCKQGKWFKHPSDIIWKYDDHHNFIWWSSYNHTLIKQNIPNKWKQGFDANLLCPVHICTPLMKLNLNFTHLYAVKSLGFFLYCFLNRSLNRKKVISVDVNLPWVCCTYRSSRSAVLIWGKNSMKFILKDLSSFFWFVTMCVCLLCRRGGREIACTDPIVRMMKLERKMQKWIIFHFRQLSEGVEDGQVPQPTLPSQLENLTTCRGRR